MKATEAISEAKRIAQELAVPAEMAESIGQALANADPTTYREIRNEMQEAHDKLLAGVRYLCKVTGPYGEGWITEDYELGDSISMALAFDLGDVFDLGRSIRGRHVWVVKEDGA